MDIPLISPPAPLTQSPRTPSAAPTGSLPEAPHRPGVFSGRQVKPEAGNPAILEAALIAYLQNPADAAEKHRLQTFCALYPPQQLTFPTSVQPSSTALVQFFKTFELKACKKLDLSNCKHVNDAVIKAIADHCKQLETLYLTDMHHTDFIKTAFSAASVLTIFMFAGSALMGLYRAFPDEDWSSASYCSAVLSVIFFTCLGVFLCHRKLSGLQEEALRLATEGKESLTAKGLTHLLSLKSAEGKGLTHLRVRLQQFRNQEIAVCKQLLRQFTHLQSLSIAVNAVSPRQEGPLSPLLNNLQWHPHLQTFSLYHNFNLLAQWASQGTLAEGAQL